LSRGKAAGQQGGASGKPGIIQPMAQIRPQQQFMGHAFRLKSPSGLAAGHGGHYLIRFAMHQQHGRAGGAFGGEAFRAQKRAGMPKAHLAKIMYKKSQLLVCG
jgi:hypothetical protein